MTYAQTMPVWIRHLIAHHPALLRLQITAEELSHAVFVELLARSHRKKARGLAAFLPGHPYFYSEARYALADVLRRRYRQQGRERLTPYPEAPAEPTNVVEDELHEHIDVERRYYRLPNEARRLVDHRVRSQMNLDEMAAALGISRSTAHRRWREVRDELVPATTK